MFGKITMKMVFIFYFMNAKYPNGFGTYQLH